MSSIEKLLRQGYPPELPYGFAERTAGWVMGSEGAAIWDFLLTLTPRAGVAIGAVAMVLLALGFVGGGPGILDLVDHYDSLNSLIALP